SMGSIPPKACRSGCSICKTASTWNTTPSTVATTISSNSRIDAPGAATGLRVAFMASGVKTASLEEALERPAGAAGGDVKRMHTDARGFQTQPELGMQTVLDTCEISVDPGRVGRGHQVQEDRVI